VGSGFDEACFSAILIKQMSKNLRRALVPLLLVSLLLLVVLGFIIAPAPTAEPLPNPNEYDDFVRAGKMVTGRVDNFSELDEQELRRLIQTNAEPLRLARLGLTKRSAVPRGSQFAHLSELKGLARLLSGEGRLRELENRPGEAARCYAEAIHLGSAISNGGLLNRLVGIACEFLGASPLVKLVPNLTCEQSRLLITQLEPVDTNTVNWEELLRKERRLMRAELPKQLNLLEVIQELWTARDLVNKAKVKHDISAAHMRLLTVELALRCYREERGSVPATLDQLVPKYLGRVPLDPFSDRPLVYQAQGTNWLLYSLGPDRVDDGGKPFVRTSTGQGGTATVGDLHYDSRW
jgi:hypothetical protein